MLVTARVDAQAASTIKTSPNLVPKSQVVPETDDIANINIRVSEDKVEASLEMLPKLSL